MMVGRTGIVSAMAWAFLVPIIVGLTVYTESASSPSGVRMAQATISHSPEKCGFCWRAIRG